MLTLLASTCLGQSSPQVALDTSETLFTVLAAINTCGYDAELDSSNALRSQVRDEIAKAVESSAESQEVVQTMCQIYKDHQQVDSSRTLSQYVSLALYLTPAPGLTPKVKEAEMPPDSVPLLAFPPVLEKFYRQVNLHAIWQRHQANYDALADLYHQPVSKMLFDSEIYLRLPSAYLGRGFTVYLEPMGAPGQTNARNYGSDYFVVISPGKNSDLKMEQIRHTYLHFLLDPLVLKYPDSVRRLLPLLTAVKTAPMDQSFKTDPALLATECMIRAIEARTTGSSKAPEAERLKAVEDAERQGFILTGYFYQELVKFEKGPEGLRTVYGDMLANIDVGKEEKQSTRLKFAATADPDVLRLSRPTAEPKLLIIAMQHLSNGDADGAQKLAQQALDEKREDPGRALFILAQVATSRRDMEGARKYFQQALEVASEPRVVAWSHIYLGRILDLQEDREGALGHYKAALGASAAGPEAKAAAERGIAAPYAPAHPPAEPPAQNEKAK